MTKWKIPCEYTMWGLLEVEAPTLEEAMELADDPDTGLPKPEDSCYIGGSFTLTTETEEEIRRNYNGGHKDEIYNERKLHHHG